jgi:ribonuclease HI
MRDAVEIYTDGACSGNPGPGRLGSRPDDRGVEKEISGHAVSTTNNRMEMTAAIEALRKLKRPLPCPALQRQRLPCLRLYAGMDSELQRNGWRNAAGDPVSNMDLWQDLIKASDRHQIEWIKVKGHADNLITTDAINWLWRKSENCVCRTAPMRRSRFQERKRDCTRNPVTMLNTLHRPRL